MKLSRQFTRREQVLLVILALLFLFAVYFLAVHLPVKETIEHARTESENLSTEIMVLEAKAERMSQMQAELDAILSQPNVSEIPDYDNLQRVMDFLNTVLGSAEDYSLSFQGLKQTDGNTILRREMQMSFTSASYSAAKDVLENLQNCPFRCQLGNLTVAPSASSADAVLTAGPVQVSLTVTFFENS